jgi:hypothetical protein
MNSTLRKSILLEIRTTWSQVAAQSDKDEVMGTPPDDLTIFEASNANFAEASCLGDFSALETLDRSSQSRASACGHPRDLLTVIRGAYWQNAQARFHISETRGMAVLELVFGPRYGRGYRFVRLADGSISKGNVWIS